jgi:hypothetical protein
MMGIMKVGKNEFRRQDVLLRILRQNFRPKQWHPPTTWNVVESSWNVMVHGDAREGKWRGNWRMEWGASTLPLPRNMLYPSLLPLIHTHRLPVVDCPLRCKWTRPFRRKKKSGFCACAITFQTQSGDKSHAWLLFISFSFAEIREGGRTYLKPCSCTQHCNLFFSLLTSTFHAKLAWYFEISKLKKN